MEGCKPSSPLGISGFKYSKSLATMRVQLTRGFEPRHIGHFISTKGGVANKK